MDEQIVERRMGALNVDMTVIELRTLTADIHAAYLFERLGFEILQQILIHVGATQVEVDDSNWKAFGDRLGVTRQQLENIQHYFQGKQGPVWCVLATYAQLNEAVVARVILALFEIERFDVIKLIDDDVREFVRRVSVRKHEAAGHVLPLKIPWVPLVLRPKDAERNNGWRVENAVAIIANPLVPGVQDGINDDPVFVPVYTILLTFANDGTDAAHRITKILRTYNPRIGVLLFEEHLMYISERDHEFVLDCLAQVDTIMPILTEGYYDAIKATSTAEPPLGKDQELARWIFQSILDEYKHNNYVNRRVKCIVPKENTNKLEANPVFRAYMSEAEIGKLIDLLLVAKFGKRRLNAMREEPRA